MIFDQKEMMKFNFTNFTKVETFSSNWVAYENVMILKIIFTWQDYKFACVYPFSMSFFDRTSLNLNFYYLLIPVFCIILKQYIRSFIFLFVSLAFIFLILIQLDNSMIYFKWNTELFYYYCSYKNSKKITKIQQIKRTEVRIIFFNDTIKHAY